MPTARHLIKLSNKASSKFKDLSHLAVPNAASQVFKAQNGCDGRIDCRRGACGQNLIVDIPLNTKVIDVDRKALLSDKLSIENDFVVAAHGGCGGLGNSELKTSTDQCPEKAEVGAKGLKRIIELKLI